MKAAPSWTKHARIAAEFAALFGGVIGLDRALGGSMRFILLEPNPLWLPVIAMALAYGTGLGVAAAALASGYWLWAAPAPTSGDDLDRLLHALLPPLMWFVAAVAIGEVTLARGRRIVWLRRQSQGARRNVRRLAAAIEELDATNRALQVRLASDRTTTGHIVATAARLGTNDPAARRAAMAALVAQAAGTDDFTCYLASPDGGARAWLRGAGATLRAEGLDPAVTARLSAPGDLVHVGRRGDRALLDGVGVAAVALAPGGAAMGALVIHSLPFEALDAFGRTELIELAGWLADLLEEAPRGIRRDSGVGLVA